MIIEKDNYLFAQFRRLLSALILMTYQFQSAAQESTVGLVQFSGNLSEAYTLFTPLSSETTYLIDNCGNKINEWDGLQPDNSNFAQLAADGTLIRSSFNSFQKLSWENEVLWEFNIASLDLLRHHDFHVMPNGNILFIASKVYSYADMIAKGRNPSTTGNGGGQQGFKVDGLYEIKPIGNTDAELVWSWSFYDHLVQDFDDEVENFDLIGNQPRRLDVNFNGEEGTSFDWLHCNGIDYHPELDQIIVSSRSTCEFYIIDHSTTIAQAATSTGGNYGFGGDFLWRWGNPVAYEKGTVNDQKFWEQHDPKWVKNGYPNEGMITVYNNLYNFEFNGEQPYSNVHLIDPNATNGVYPIDSEGFFGPADFHFTYSGEVVGNNMWSNIMSSVQAMPNGNLFILQGTIGEMFEVNQEKEIVWVYQNPVREYIYNQGSNAQILQSSVDIFVATKYEADFDGFNDHEMIPLGTLENENELSVVCDSIISDVSIINDDNSNFSVYPNPVNELLQIESSHLNYKVTIHDLLGKEVLSHHASFNSSITFSHLQKGVYLLTFETDQEVLGKTKILKL